MIMHELYKGRIFPEQSVLPQSEEYKEACRTTSALREEIKTHLDGPLSEQFEQLRNNIYDIQSMECEVQFRYGLSLGFLMMREANENPHIREGIG